MAHIAVFVPTLTGGGAERIMLRLATEFAKRGHKVDLLLKNFKGHYKDAIPDNVHVIELRSVSKLRARYSVFKADPGNFPILLRPVLLARKPVMSMRCICGLRDYLQFEEPDVLLSALFYANLVAVWAKRLSDVKTRIVISERNTLSKIIESGLKKSGEKWRWQYLSRLIMRYYPQADSIVAVSNSVSKDLVTCARLQETLVKTIYNPVAIDEINKLSCQAINHPWFSEGQPPVLLAVGRLTAQKDFFTLINAFAYIKSTLAARLIILGEGEDRTKLESHAVSLGVDSDLSMPGWVANPYVYMKHARLFISSSAWEGLPNALIEALACGCPVVSTDCPGGSSEILADGKSGKLVPVANAEKMAEAVINELKQIKQSGQCQKRAAMFSVESSVNEYLGNMLPGCETYTKKQ